MIQQYLDYDINMLIIYDTADVNYDIYLLMSYDTVVVGL